MIKNKWLLILGGAVVVLVIATGFLVYSLQQSRSQAKALSNAFEIVEGNLMALESENRNLIDSLDRVKTDRDKMVEERAEKIAGLLEYIDEILNSKEDESTIDNMHDTDSIQQLFTKYYPDNARTGQGSD